MTATSLAADWFRHLSRAVATRQLYPADHPRTREAVSHLLTLTRSLVADAPDVSLFMLDGRLACNGTLVPGSDVAAERTFDLIHALGRDRVRILQGVTIDELEALVGALAGRPAADDGANRGLQPSAHLTYGVLETSAGPAVTTAAPLRLGKLSDIWRGIDSTHVCDTVALDALLAPLARMAELPSSHMLPLAALRDHDDYTATHIANVAVLTMALAGRVGFSAADVHQVGIAALLHDIGKMRIPTEVLNNPGQLSTAERQLIRRHPEIGASMLLQAKSVPPLAVAVAYEHHLQADGGGYPDVPRGWEIHIASALTHIADVYDALRTNRPYRGARSHDEIDAMMRRDRGTVFHAEWLDLFLDEVAPRTRTETDLAASIPR